MPMSTTPPCTTHDAGTPKAAACTTSVSVLPSELLVAVFSHLDASSSLEPRFRDDASTLMDAYYAARGPSCRRHPHHHPLKSASLVCRRWRAAVLPRLFRHVLWTLRRLEEPLPSSPGAHGEGFEALAFLQRHGLRAVESVVLHVPCPEHLIDDPTELVGRYGLVPSTAAQQQQQQPQHEDEGEEDAESVVLSETASLVLADGNSHATWANTWFWDMLFAVVDPLRVSILAAPVVLATMLSRKVFTQCQPLMMTRYHLLSVSRPDRSPPPPEHEDDDPEDEGEDEALSQASTTTTTTTRSLLAPPCDNLPCELFAPCRRWTTLLANEGSSVSIYKSDAYGAIPPSPLLSLFASRDPPTRRSLRRSLRRLAYVAVMPMATHVQSALLVACPALRLEELHVQVMPRGVAIVHGGGGGPDAAGHGRFEGLDMEDLVMERDSVYGLLFACIFIPGPRPRWEALRVFETGDAEGDEVAWAEAVETVRASASCWDVERRGRFVRNLAREASRQRRRNANLPMQGLSPPPPP